MFPFDGGKDCTLISGHMLRRFVPRALVVCVHEGLLISRTAVESRVESQVLPDVDLILGAIRSHVIAMLGKVLSG
jgi:hypothetical protein